MELQDVIKQLDDLRAHCEDMARDKESFNNWNKDAEALSEAIRLIKIIKKDQDDLEAALLEGVNKALELGYITRVEAEEIYNVPYAEGIPLEIKIFMEKGDKK